MHHTISYQLAQARIADLRQLAQRNTLARAARRVWSPTPWPLRMAEVRPARRPGHQAASEGRSTACVDQPRRLSSAQPQTERNHDG